MKICLYNSQEVGVIVGERVYPIAAALFEAGDRSGNSTMVDVVERLGHDPAAAQRVRDLTNSGRSLPLTDIKLRAPIYDPPTIWAAALNYRQTSKERRAAVDPARIQAAKEDLMAEFFLKPRSSISGPGETIVLPKIAKDVSLDCELCAVIGKTARHVGEAQALDCVFGYTICLDISLQDPWGPGKPSTRMIRKGFNTFTPLGPWIVTRDEIDEPQNLAIRVEKNGALVLDGHTENMICSLREHIRFLSSVATLYPGDLISTGSPASVEHVKDGDQLRASIEKIGVMDLGVKQEE
jgi:2-keto-4-pentenoate hydratase/2-oxohepta-3-ene-1,7-dioic acid hydratase in catechol pathway